MQVKNKSRIFIAAFLLSLSASLLTGCADSSPSSAVGYQFDTVITLNGYCDKELLDGALAECAKYEKLLSKTVEGSDVWRINHSGGAPVEVSDDTAAVITLALKVSRESDGAFDVTTAKETELWDFKADTPSLPDADALAEAAALTGWERLTLDGNTVTLPEGMAIDLGGIAKGYIADKIAEYLTEKGVKCAVISLGGNVVMVGKKPDGNAWRVGIQKPYGETGEYVSLIERDGGSAVTSGVYERGFDLNGVRYHHILNPETGMPVQNGLLSVTVFCESSALADALSTACFVLGQEHGEKLLEYFGAEGAFLSDDGLYMTD